MNIMLVRKAFWGGGAGASRLLRPHRRGPYESLVSSLLCRRNVSVPSASGPSAASSSVESERPDKPSEHFKPYYFQAWQKAVLRSMEDDTSVATAAPPSFVYVFGDKLGPRPLLILDQAQQPAAERPCGMEKYEPALRFLQWEHGVVYVPLNVAPTPTGGEGEAVLAKSCREVCGVLDMLDVRWTHVLGYSYGALVAACMASSPLSSSTPSSALSLPCAHRIGTILLADTPLLTAAMLQNERRRCEWRKAEADVNVPLERMEAAKTTLLQQLEPPLPTPCAADAGLYQQYLFDPVHTFPPMDEAVGLYRDSSRYLPLKDLLDCGHPIDLILPAERPVAEVEVFKEVFGVRRPTVIQSARLKEGDNKEEAAALSESVLFECMREPSTRDSCAKEMARALRGWMERHEPDKYIQRQFQQASKEMQALLNAKADSASGEGESKGRAPGKEKKKKANKKKSQ